MIRSPNRSLSEKILEKIPGIITWTVITSPIWGGLLFPEIMAYFLICFCVFWMLRAVRSGLSYLYSSLKLRLLEQVDWVKFNYFINTNSSLRNHLLSRKLDNCYLKSFVSKNFLKINNKFTRYFLNLYLSDYLKNTSKDMLNISEINHVIVIPFASEGYSVLNPVIQALTKQTFNRKHIFVVLSSEKRRPEGKHLAKKLKDQYYHYFGGFDITEHTLTDGEIIGKCSNLANGGRFAYEQLIKNKLDINYTTITSCDCDSVLPPKYFEYLSFLFSIDPNRYTNFYHGAMCYIANYWEIPLFSRILNSSFTINNIANLVRPYQKLVQVSTYSSSFKLIKNIDFWSVNVVPEDFHTFFKALFKYGNKVHVEPMFLKILSDAAQGQDFFDTFKKQYIQVERWAYGVVDFPFLIKNLLNLFKKGKLSFYILFRTLSVMFDHQMWPISGIIMFIGANLVLFVNPEFTYKVLGSNLSLIQSKILSISTSFYFFVIIVNFSIRPSKKFNSLGAKLINTGLELFNWILFPVYTLILNVIPGLQTHTKLLFGKYMEHIETQKK